MLRWWLNLLPFGFVVWLSRRKCERYTYTGEVAAACGGVFVTISEDDVGNRTRKRG